MTESSYPWNGTTTGHAATGAYTAPYCAEEVVLAQTRMGNDISVPGARGGTIVLGYGDGLLVRQTSPASNQVVVPSGSAIVGGIHYYNDADILLTISSNTSGNPRIDRVVLRANWSTQTVTATIVEGTPASTPIPPALTQNWGTVWECALAQIWVADSFSTITYQDIHDDRAVIAPPVTSQIHAEYHNSITNSEFMAFSGLASGTGLLPPDRWDLVGTPANITSATKPSRMSRGRAVQFTTDAASEGLSQTFPVKSGSAYFVKALIYADSGIGVLTVTTNSASPIGAVKYLRETGTWKVELIPYIIESDATTMTVSYTGLASGATLRLGQVTARKTLELDFQPFHETIPFSYQLTDSNWNGTLKSSGTTTINLASGFGGYILPFTSGIFINIGGKDSGSSGSSTTRIAAQPYGSAVDQVSAYCAGKANNSPAFASGLVALDSQRRFNLAVVASGSNTFTAYCYITGITT